MSTPPPLPIHNPYAAPLARVDDDAAGDLVLADRGVRFVAAIIDGLVVAVLGVAAAIVIPALQPAGGGEPDPVLLGVVLLLVVGGLIAVIVVNLLWLHRYGQTIGKRVLKIKVMRSDGSRCALSRIVFARWLPISLLGAIPLLGPALQLADSLFIFRDDRRCLHDLIADTVVVRA